MPVSGRSQIWSKFHWILDFFFFADFHSDVPGNWINIYKWFCNAVLLKKKLVRPLKLALLGPYLGKSRTTSKFRFNFFLELTKKDHKLSRTFYFIKISKYWTKLWMIFCVVCYFAAKTGHYQLKQLFYPDPFRHHSSQTSLPCNA